MDNILQDSGLTMFFGRIWRQDILQDIWCVLHFNYYTARFCCSVEYLLSIQFNIYINNINMAYMGQNTNINDLGNGLCILCQLKNSRRMVKQLRSMAVSGLQKEQPSHTRRKEPWRHLFGWLTITMLQYTICLYFVEHTRFLNLDIDMILHVHTIKQLFTILRRERSGKRNRK